MSDVTNILLTGVGGQGIILASRVLANAALKAGFEVKVSEIHGMAQRGGSVVTHLRFGRQVYSPLVSTGQADYLVAFEKLEAIRYLPYLKKDGWLIVNDQVIYPLPVLLGKASYPPDSSSFLKEQVGGRMRLVPALERARRLGNPRAVNLFLLGVLAQFLDIPQQAWQDAIASCVRPAYLEVNKTAFLEGLAS